MLKNRKLVVTMFVVAIVLVTLIGVIPSIVSSFSGPGVKTEGLSDDHARPASTQLDGTWQIVHNRGRNATSVGFTFPEVLPGDRRVTSASTQEVHGQVEVTGQELVAADVEVDLTALQSDNERRDINVRNKIFDTDTYPSASFTLTEPARLDEVPDNGVAGKVELTGELSIKGTTNKVSALFDVLRDDDRVVVAGTLPINRLDYGVETPDFVAAKIAEDGEVNIRLTLEKAGEEAQ
ncbi:hypothetical protein CATYP_05345 [Corynebacterium atypicum]|uniref:Lipid/polyisoprenoid-binding YceI-like domain-containing protein n=1 Tax=Corynebacterium atypicum TaxID=191610 RepID=A0ABN4DCM3_9CORY|nr:YceI family protein [Corynebacterium atypicum]AIG64144.1 hypothetical protein CATYP_05345 [Corynebacterium atypicum]